MDTFFTRLILQGQIAKIYNTHFYFSVNKYITVGRGGSVRVRD